MSGLPSAFRIAVGSFCVLAATLLAACAPSSLQGTATETAAPSAIEPRDSEAWYAEAEEFARSQLGFATVTLQAALKRPLSAAERDTLLAMMAVRFVSTRISAMRYGQIVYEEGTPIATTDDAIAYQAGICGHHAEAALRLLRRLGLTARSVQFYRMGPSGADSHIVIEVLIDGKWRMMDVTWRAWFLRDPDNPLDLVSGADLAKHGRAAFTARRDETGVHSIVMKLADHAPGAAPVSDVLSYLDPWPNKVTLYGQAGTVRLPVKDATWSPAQTPSFVGRTLDAGELSRGTLNVVLADTDRPAGFVLDGVAAACAKGGALTAHDSHGRLLGKRSVSAVQRDGRLPLKERPASGEDVLLSVRGAPGDACYVVYQKISQVA